MRLLALLLTLTACAGDLDTDVDTGDHPCDLVDEVEACWDGCDAVRATDAYNWGRLACLHGDDWRTLSGPADQGRGSAFQSGYRACYWEEVRDGWGSENCNDATTDLRRDR